MAKVYDVKIAFEFQPFKVLFDEMFFKKLGKSSNLRIKIADAKKENNYKDLVYPSRWVSIRIS